MIVEEVLRQRLEGIKNEKGVYITPAFPKLVYVLDEHNCLKGGKYDYITELAVKCSASGCTPTTSPPRRCGRTMRATCSPPWDAAPSWPPGRTRTETTSSRAASTRAWSP